MQNLLFPGIILVGKEKKFKTKTQKQYKNKNKKIKASHFAVETVGTSMVVGTAGRREGAGGSEGSRQGHCSEKPQKKKRKKKKGKRKKKKKKKAGWGPNRSLLSKKERGSGVFCS